MLEMDVVLLFSVETAALNRYQKCSTIRTIVLVIVPRTWQNSANRAMFRSASKLNHLMAWDVVYW